VLTKVTVNLTAVSVAALNRSAQYEELSRTDVINRALQLYAEVTTADPNTELCVITPTGDKRRLVVKS
jgi:hypothetical protein